MYIVVNVNNDFYMPVQVAKCCLFFPYVAKIFHIYTYNHVHFKQWASILIAKNVEIYREKMKYVEKQKLSLNFNHLLKTLKLF